MIVTALAARWLFIVVFAAAGLGAALPRRGLAGTARPMDRISAIFCAAMCVALTAMTWWPELAAATCRRRACSDAPRSGSGRPAWPVTARLAGHGRARRPNALALLHALMAGTMIWMLTAMPAMTGMTSPGSARGAMPPMPRAAPPVPVLVTSIVMRDGVEAAGEFVEIDPPRGLVFTWGWTHDPAVPPWTTRVVVTLQAEPGGTRVVLRHYGMPDDGQRDHHRTGWAFYLDRLHVRIQGGDPGPDPNT